MSISRRLPVVLGVVKLTIVSVRLVVRQRQRALTLRLALRIVVHGHALSEVGILKRRIQNPEVLLTYLFSRACSTEGSANLLASSRVLKGTTNPLPLVMFHLGLATSTTSSCAGRRFRLKSRGKSLIKKIFPIALGQVVTAICPFGQSSTMAQGAELHVTRKTSLIVATIRRAALLT
jgi:hypothetical protein